MYRPPAFAEDGIAALHAFVQTYPLGLLITSGPGGLSVNPIPFQLAFNGDREVLRGHLARANPQLAELGAADCLIVFQGPHAYVSPSWYATKAETGKVVPTWNYMIVEAHGRARLIDDPLWLRAQIAALTEGQEASFPDSWTVDDAPADFITGQIKGIVGVEIAVDRLFGKWKLSQNRSEADRAGVIEGLTAQGHTALAAAMATAKD